MKYYDLVLGAIPLVLIGATAGLTTVGMTLNTALWLTGTISLGIMVHAMFVRSPVNETLEHNTHSDGLSSRDVPRQDRTVGQYHNAQ